MQPEDSEPQGAAYTGAMAQPNFTWWPWRILALSVPWVAFAGALAAWQQEEFARRIERDEQTLRVLLALYAGGNGLLLGAAIGDLGRSLLAMFVGTAMALLLGPLCTPEWFWVCVPLVIGSFTGCLALEADLDGIVGAMLAGIVDFAVGLGLALPVFIVVLVAGEAIGVRGDGVLPAMVVSSGIANVIFVGRMFRRAHRVRGEGGEGGDRREIADLRLEEKPVPPSETSAEQPPPPKS